MASYTYSAEAPPVSRRFEPAECLTCEDLAGDWTGFSAPGERNGRTLDAALPLTLSRSIKILDDATPAVIVSRAASVDETGRTLFRGDLRAQLRRAFITISDHLARAQSSWSDIVRVTCFVCHKAQDAPAVCDEFAAFCRFQELTPPALIVVEAILSRPDLLVEIETIAATSRHPR